MLVIAVAQLLAGSQVREVSQSLHREALASKQRVHGLVYGSRFVQQGKISDAFTAIIT